MSEVCDGFGRLYRGPSVGAGEGGGGGAGDLKVVGGVNVFAVIAVVFVLWLDCAPCDSHVIACVIWACARVAWPKVWPVSWGAFRESSHWTW